MSISGGLWLGARCAFPHVTLSPALWASCTFLPIWWGDRGLEKVSSLLKVTWGRGSRGFQISACCCPSSETAWDLFCKPEFWLHLSWPIYPIRLVCFVRSPGLLTYFQSVLKSREVSAVRRGPTSGHLRSGDQQCERWAEVHVQWAYVSTFHSVYLMN